MKRNFNKFSTSWSPVGKWYSGIVGNKGQYYQEQTIIPGIIRLLKLQEKSSLLDLGCGEGVLARHIPRNVSYLGIDIAHNLITEAKNKDHRPNHQYIVADCTKPLTLNHHFTHAIFMLSLQNMENSRAAIENAFHKLCENGILLLVINHPCFRIPRQSGWGIFEHNKLQYRWINRYLTPMKIPITMHPGQNHSPITWTFHYPISYYSNILKDTGFLTSEIEEWTSDKTSEGKAARMENRARSEIPLFMAIKAIKISYGRAKKEIT